MALDLATAIAAQPPVGLPNIRAELAGGPDGTFEDALARELEAELECFATPEFQANLRAFAERHGH